MKHCLTNNIAATLGPLNPGLLEPVSSPNGPGEEPTYTLKKHYFSKHIA